MPDDVIVQTPATPTPTPTATPDDFEDRAAKWAKEKYGADPDELRRNVETLAQKASRADQYDALVQQYEQQRRQAPPPRPSGAPDSEEALRELGRLDPYEAAKRMIERERLGTQWLITQSQAATATRFQQALAGEVTRNAAVKRLYDDWPDLFDNDNDLGRTGTHIYYNEMSEIERTNPNALLLCKMTSVDRVHSINDILSREQFAEVGRLLPPIINEKIWITKQVLTREEMTALYDVSDHYLCTSHAEGQNLPLLEAMGRGVVPVAVAGTAMEDYISEETAVVVPTEVRPFGKRLTARYGLYGLNTHFTTADWVADALRAAVRLPSEIYAAKSSAGLDTVRRRYGVAAFAAAIKGLEQRLAVPGADQ